MHSQITQLKFELGESLEREKSIKEKEAEKKQRWKAKAQHYLGTIKLLKSNGESEWLNVYNQLMDQITSLRKDVDHLRIEKDILTKRAIIQHEFNDKENIVNLEI